MFYQLIYKRGAFSYQEVVPVSSKNAQVKKRDCLGTRGIHLSIYIADINGSDMLTENWGGWFPLEHVLMWSTNSYIKGGALVIKR